MKKFMHFLARLFPTSETGENPAAVRMFAGIASVKEFFKKLKSISSGEWPVYSGNYRIINSRGQIAVCTLTSENLLEEEDFSAKIAIVGTVITPNLGIERIILNTISNPNICQLLVCGKDSPVFGAGQAIECLFTYGVDNDKRIINAEGHFPVLRNLSKETINQFLEQVQFINLKGERQRGIIRQKINEIEPKSIPAGIAKRKTRSGKETFTELKTGGKRIPLDYDRKGFFVITANNEQKKITVMHYYKDNQPGFIVRGRSAEAILLAILGKGLVSQMSHAGYLGAELAKAETALRLNLNYTQDQSLTAGKNFPV